MVIMRMMRSNDTIFNGEALVKEKLLTKSDFKPNNLWALIRVNGILFSIPLLLLAFHLLFKGHSYLLAILVFVFLGAQIYKVTIIFHDLAHLTLFSSKKISIFYIRICESLLGVSFSDYRRLHLHHHRWCGTDKDTEEGLYRELEGKNSMQVFFFLVEPLIGLTYLRRFFKAPIRNDIINEKSDKYQTRKSTRLFNTLVIQGLLFCFASNWFDNIYYVVVYPFAAMTFALFFSRVRGVVEHVPVQVTQQKGECFLRTHYFNPFDFLFFYSLNMNFHIEHHTYPQVPAVNLPDVSKRLRLNDNGTEVDHYSRSVIVTLFNIFKVRMRK